MPSNRRTIRWEHSAAAAQDAFAADIPRLDEIIAGIEDRISYAAESCEEVPGTPWRGAASIVTQTTPVIVVVFFTIESDDLCTVSAMWAPGA